jgi:divalent metal cation (Fe/Co/Zn/Cd) transporter
VARCHLLAGALVGLFAVELGFHLGDPIAGFFITLFIMHVGYEVTRDVFYHLMDGIEPEYIEQARDAAAAVAGVPVPIVRGRWLGRSLVLELQPTLPANVSLGDADAISRRIEDAVFAAVEEAETVTVMPRVPADT